MKGLIWLKKQRLSQQLLLSFGLALATVGLGTLWINYRLIQADLKKQVLTRAQSITQSIEFATEGLLQAEERSTLRRVIQNYATLPAVVEIAIISPNGMIMADSQGTSESVSFASTHPELTLPLDQAGRTGIAVSYPMTFQGKPVLAQILPFSSILFGTSGRRGLAIAIIDLRQIQQEAGTTFLASTLTLLAGIVVILFLMGVLIRRNVLQPLDSLNQAVVTSKTTATFAMPANMPANEIRFLAKTFQTVFEQLEAYEQLQAEIAQRQKVEATLRDSEARERNKSQQLEQTLLELRQAQTQLVQSEKMSSLGQLVAGVAHEINNPISFIHGNVQYASEYIQDLLQLLELYEAHYPQPAVPIQQCAEALDLGFMRDDLPKLLLSMKVGADRIREIVQSLRTFSRLDESEVKDVDIHEGLDSTLMILQSRLKPHGDRPEIRVVKDYSHLPRIECYAGQLNQVFMNILVNAIDALDERFKGTAANPEATSAYSGELTITIRTERVSSDRLAIHITDNGPGMSELTQQRIFDPFFTTKPVGKGTGMGMSISYQIITEKHQGSLRCQSQVGQGTTFVIEIPMAQNRAETLTKTTVQSH